jgi:hypothetical protein
MTPDERTLLTGFLNDLANARAGTKDPEAEGWIKQVLSSNPDAAYLLVQHAILSDQALHTAQDQIAQLQAQGQGGAPAGRSTSFLGGGQSSGGYAQPAPATSVPPTGGYGQQPAYAPQAYTPPPAQPFSSGGGLGSFLRSAGTMAAGVAGGEFLFSGLSGLFGGGHGGGFGGMGGGFGGGGFGGPSVENVTINEYGDDNDNDDGDYGDDGDNGGDDGN